MQTTTQSIIERDKDILAARRFADHIVHILQDFIPRHCYQDAHTLLAQTAHEHKFELTTLAMRKEYEAWKSTQIEAELLKPLIIPKDKQ